MTMNLYVVYDIVQQMSMPVFEARNDGTAMRMFQKSVVEAEDIPEEEMELWCVGKIDHNTNIIEEVGPYKVIPNLGMEMEDE